jgi:drug/metabolite transporter (DMT)-like permease
MDHTGSHVLGIGLIVASTAFFGLAGVFTNAKAAGPWMIAGWRGLIGAILIAAYVFWRRGSKPLPVHCVLVGAAGRWRSSASSPASRSSLRSNSPTSPMSLSLDI